MKQTNTDKMSNIKAKIWDQKAGEYIDIDKFKEKAKGMKLIILGKKFIITPETETKIFKQLRARYNPDQDVLIFMDNLIVKEKLETITG